MKTLLSALALGLVALFAADRAQAVSLNVVTGAPVVDAPFATADYSELVGVGDLSLFGAEAESLDLSPTGTLFLNFVIDFDAADPYATAEGTLFSDDDGGAFLNGELVKAGYDGPDLQLLFGDLTGSASDDFGRFALATVFFNDPFPGEDPLTNLVDGTAYDVSVELSSVAPIPLPATLPLLLAGLAGLALMRRRG